MGRGPAAKDMVALDTRLDDRLFWRYVEPEPNSGCWIWTGTIVNRYGHVTRDYKIHLVHRYAYTALVGPIPPGLHLDHLCRVTLCVNPTHLEPVSPLENTLRSDALSALNARKSHCLRGHVYDRIQWSHGRPARYCLTCRAVFARQYRRARRGESAP